MGNHTSTPPETLDQLREKVETQKQELREMQQTLTKKRQEVQKQEANIARQQSHRDARCRALHAIGNELLEKKERLQKMEDELAADWEGYHLSGKQLGRERTEVMATRKAFELEQQRYFERREELDSHQGEMVSRLVEIAAKFEITAKSPSDTPQEPHRHQDRPLSPDSSVTPLSQAILKSHISPDTTHDSKDPLTAGAVPPSSTNDRQTENQPASGIQQSPDQNLQNRSTKEEITKR
jgi:hypothetical protein